MAKAVFETRYERSDLPLYRVYDGETLVMKRCAKCEQHKKPGAFHKDASRKDGLMLRCRECCGVNVNRKPMTAEEKRRRQRKYDAAYKARQRANRKCECGALIEYGARGRICGECKDKQAAYKARVRKRGKIARDYSNHQKGTAGRKVWYVGDCPECGESYVKRRPGQHCSDKCRRKMRAARRRAAKHGDDVVIGSYRIFMRDEYICWLCSKITDRTAHYLDPQAPTLDHVVPVSLGGRHTEDNLRTAHRICNSARTGPGQGR